MSNGKKPESIQKSLHRIEDLARDARACENHPSFNKKSDLVIFEAVNLLNVLIGDLWARRLWQAGHDDYPAPNPDNDVEAFNKKGLARLVYDMQPILSKAKLAPEILTRDLHHMAIHNGADSKLLSPPIRDRKFRKDRDIKKAARMRVCEIIYFEHGRTKETITKVRHRLNNTADWYFSAEEKAWNGMTKEFPKKKRELFKAQGRLSSMPHPKAREFQRLWQEANTP